MDFYFVFSFVGKEVVIILLEEGLNYRKKFFLMKGRVENWLWRNGFNYKMGGVCELDLKKIVED